MTFSESSLIIIKSNCWKCKEKSKHWPRFPWFLFLLWSSKVASPIWSTPVHAQSDILCSSQQNDQMKLNVSLKCPRQRCKQKTSLRIFKFSVYYFTKLQFSKKYTLRVLPRSTKLYWQAINQILLHWIFTKFHFSFEKQNTSMKYESDLLLWWADRSTFPISRPLFTTCLFQMER